MTIAVNIQWDIDDDEKDSIALPGAIVIPEEIETDDGIVDYITDYTGFCHNGFEIARSRREAALRRQPRNQISSN